MGAFLGVISKISPYRIRREEATCIHCNICDKRCPVNINVSVKPAVTSAECINCLICVTDCPTKKKTLQPSFSSKYLRPILVAVAGLIIYAGITGAAKVTGTWQSAYKPLEELAKEGTLNPDDIKGLSSLEQVSETFHVNLDELYSKLGITKEQVPPQTLIREIKFLVPGSEFEAEQVRAAVKEMLNIIPDTVEKPETIIPNEQILKPADFELEGTMTLSEVSERLGVPVEQVINKLELNTDIPPGTPLRELQKDFGFTMPALKEKFRQTHWQ